MLYRGTVIVLYILTTQWYLTSGNDCVRFYSTKFKTQLSVLGTHSY